MTHIAEVFFCHAPLDGVCDYATLYTSPKCFSKVLAIFSGKKRCFGQSSRVGSATHLVAEFWSLQSCQMNWYWNLTNHTRSAKKEVDSGGYVCTAIGRNEQTASGTVRVVIKVIIMVMYSMMINIMMINVMMINVMVISVMVTKNMVIKLTLVVPKKLNDVGSSCLESPFAEEDLWSTSDGKPSAIFKMV